MRLEIYRNSEITQKSILKSEIYIEIRNLYIEIRNLL